MPGMKELVLAKIEQIETLHEREREIYSEIKAMGEMVYDNAWDKLAREVVESRRAARVATEDAADNLRGFDWMFTRDDDGALSDELVEITPERMWAEISPKLHEMFDDDKRLRPLVDQIDRLSAATAEA